MLKTVEKEGGFLLLKPKTSANAGKIARAIAMCNGVKEVFLTSGEYGFVAIIEATANKGIRNISQIVEKTGGVKGRALIKHYIYKGGGKR